MTNIRDRTEWLDLVSTLRDKTWNSNTPRIKNRRLLLIYDDKIEADSLMYIIDRNNQMETGGSITIGYCPDDGITKTYVVVDFGKTLTKSGSASRNLFDYRRCTNTITPHFKVILDDYQFIQLLGYVTEHQIQSVIIPGLEDMSISCSSTRSHFKWG